MTFQSWYTADEASEAARLVEKRIYSFWEGAEELPTPCAIFVLFVDPGTNRAREQLRSTFEFWAWTEPLRNDREPSQTACPPSTLSCDLDALYQSSVATIKKLFFQDSAWMKISRDLRNKKTPFRLPPQNFRHPTQETGLMGAFRALQKGEKVALPRVQRPPRGLRFSHDRHYEDAGRRFFVCGKGDEHGVLRELTSLQTQDRAWLRSWLSGAYRFGTWVGDNQEHFDVQKARGPVSPPDVYCALRDATVTAQAEYVNLFMNDVVRDGSLFRKK